MVGTPFSLSIKILILGLGYKHVDRHDKTKKKRYNQQIGEELFSFDKPSNC